MPSQSGVVAWSQNAADNDNADSSVNYTEGQAPSSLNDSGRGVMASAAKYRDDTAGSLTTGGTTTAYTLTTNQVFSALSVLDGQSLKVRFDQTNGASPTLNVDSLGAKAIQVDATNAVGEGVILADSIWDVTYDDNIPAFILTGAAQSQTGGIADKAVTYAKIQDETDQTILGNFSGDDAAPSEYTLSGPTVSGSVISFPYPPAGSFAGLSVKVATNTTVTVAADYVTMTDGSGGFITRAISATCNLGSNGAVNKLDTGTIASGTWYFIFAISDGSTHGTLASTSATAPTMPSGYTYKARIGAVVTASGSAQLMGTWQFGRETQYVVGLAQTSSVPVIANGSAGTYSGTSPTLAAVSVSSFVPSTASKICLIGDTSYHGNLSSILIAPSTSWGGTNNGPTGTNNTGWPLWGNGGGSRISQKIEMMLEDTTVAWASSGTGGVISCFGWVDNL
jgi:hypothetical protein